MGAFARFDPLLQEKIVHRLGWSSLRPVQELASDAILDGNNCVILAPTAGGKTEAAMFPVLSGCLTNQELGMRMLYICPTRALINNQEQRLGEYASMLGLGAFKWHGDVTAATKKKFLREPCEVLLTTPESLEVMLVSGSVPTAKLFKQLKYVIIDEVHALASCDRGNHLISVLERIRAYCDNDFQRIGLSATIGNPVQILEWLQGSSKNPQQLVDPPKKPGKKRVEIKLTNEPGELVTQVIHAAHGIKSLLFCESRRLVEKISSGLKKGGDPIYVHHSSLSREEREISEKEFHEGSEACIVCTSTMELGIDVGDLDKVLQVDCPATVSSFLQRMGRTGRRGDGVANTTFFIEKESKLLQAIAIVELARSHWVENVRTQRKVWHILLHQIMAMCLERGAVSPNMLWDQLHEAYCFSEISREKFDQFIGFLLSKDFLHDDGRMYSLGLKAEKAFGRKNFMEIYSVFSTPLEFEVSGLSGEMIGTVQWDFLEKLLEESAAFYLAGRAWFVERIEWKNKCVLVVPAPAGKVPKWGGTTPSFLSYELCRKMRDILISDESYPYLDIGSKESLDSMRDDRGELLFSEFAPIEYDEKGVIWWTWAGGNINNTLRTILKIELNTDVQASNEYVRVKSDAVTLNIFTGIMKKISSPSYWSDPELLGKIYAMVPNYHLSKFQPYLPEALQFRLLADSIFDIDGTLEFLKEVWE
ncbi:DEAD/DEAH box helicase [Desulfosediminicola sp.]|uniref:DEAD/DEAH box helicase n=1 Tax=Desulfosediminicola sp. TaxID=2886825 RepID=UPI003AF23279